MTAQMTPERLAEIDARIASATPGPWEVIDSNQGHPAGAEWEVHAPSIKSEEHTGWVCQQSEVHGEDGGIAWTGVGGRRDAEFIAHAPQDIADLRAEVDRLSAQVAAAEKACNDEPHDDKSGYCVACTVLEAMECASHRTGERAEVVDPPAQIEVVDLVAALRASVEAAKARRKAAGR